MSALRDPAGCGIYVVARGRARAFVAGRRRRTRRPQMASVVVYGPTEKDERIDAPYRLTLRRLR